MIPRLSESPDRAFGMGYTISKNITDTKHGENGDNTSNY